MANYWGVGRIGTHQSVSYSATAGTITNAVSNGVQKVRVVATTACYVTIGKSPTATTASAYLPADSPEYFTVAEGEKVSAVQLSSGGTLHVTEIG